MPVQAERANSEFLAAFREIVVRIQKSLAVSKEDLAEPIRIYVAGGAAVHFYTGARVTEDIDATLSRRVLLPDNLEVAFRDVDGTPRVLYWDRQYSDTLGLLHGDAYKHSHALEFDGIDAALIDLRLLSPVDLAVSKLSRYSEDDRNDVRHLAERGLLDAAMVRERAEEALVAYVGQQNMVRIALDECCDLIAQTSPGKRKRPG